MKELDINSYIENISEEKLKSFLNLPNIKIENHDSFIEFLKDDHLITDVICSMECDKSKGLLIKLGAIFHLKDVKIDELYELIISNAAYVMIRDTNWETSELSLINEDLDSKIIMSHSADFKYSNKWGHERNKSTYKIMFYGESLVWVGNNRLFNDPQYFILLHGKIYGINYIHKNLTVYLNLEDCFKAATTNNLDDIITQYADTKLEVKRIDIDLSEYFYKGFFYKGLLWDSNWIEEISRIRDISFFEGLLKIEIENLTYPHSGCIFYDMETNKISAGDVP